MRAVLQRVSKASVDVEGESIGSIDEGLLVLLAVHGDDTDEDLDYIYDKTVNLRIFTDDEGKMNLSLKDIGGSLLVVSQFTLYGDVRKGRRPSFTESSGPDLADHYYQEFIKKAKADEIPVETGEFGAHMEVNLTNDGPVTILLDSSKLF